MSFLQHFQPNGGWLGEFTFDFRGGSNSIIVKKPLDQAQKLHRRDPAGISGPCRKPTGISANQRESAGISGRQPASRPKSFTMLKNNPLAATGAGLQREQHFWRDHVLASACELIIVRVHTFYNIDFCIGLMKY